MVAVLLCELCNYANNYSDLFHFFEKTFKFINQPKLSMNVLNSLLAYNNIDRVAVCRER